MKTLMASSVTSSFNMPQELLDQWAGVVRMSEEFISSIPDGDHIEPFRHLIGLKYLLEDYYNYIYTSNV